MARFAYFADMPDGTAHEWICDARGNVRGIDNQGHGKVRGYAEGLGWIPVTRTVELKAYPTRHECDARCMNATGRVMRCECACGGRNHGKGAFRCEAA